MRILHWVTIWILHPRCVVPTRSHGVVHGECRRSWPHSIMDAGILKVAASVSMGTWQWCEVLEGGNFGVKTRLTLHHTTCQDLDAYVVQCIHGDQIDWNVDLVIGLCVVVPGWWQLRAGGVWCVGRDRCRAVAAAWHRQTTQAKPPYFVINLHFHNKLYHHSYPTIIISSAETRTCDRVSCTVLNISSRK